MEEYKETLWEWTSGWISAIYWRIRQWFQSKMKRKLFITTLDRRYCDRDEILLHAAFQILVDYYKYEHPREHHYFEYAHEVIDSLHTWWTVFRPQRIDPFNSQYFEGIAEPSFEETWVPCEKGFKEFVVDENKYGEYWEALRLAAEIEEKYMLEDTEKLMLLCEYRSCMWT